MYNQDNNSYPDQSTRPSILLVAFIIFQIMFFIIVITLFSENIQEKQVILNIDNLAKVDITNGSVIPDLSNKEIIKYVEQTLFNMVMANSQTKAAPHSLKANFYEDSISSFTFPDSNLNYFSAIIDVPELSESYRLMLQYSIDDSTYSQPSFIIFCPESRDSLYSDFQCQDTITQDEKIRYISSQLPYFSFDKFSIYMMPNNYSTVYISPITDNANDAEMKAYISQAKDAIASLGVDSSQFNYYVLTAKDIVYDY